MQRLTDLNMSPTKLDNHKPPFQYYFQASCEFQLCGGGSPTESDSISIESLSEFSESTEVSDGSLNSMSDESPKNKPVNK